MNADLVDPRSRLWLYAACALVLIFLVVPVLIVVPMSFSGSRFLDFPPPQWSLRWYERLLESAVWKDALWISLKLAAVTALVATPLGVAAAYALHTSESRATRWIKLLLMMPMMVPNIAMAIGLFYAFVRLELLGSFWGLVLAHSMLALPFAMVAALAGLRSFDMTLELAARSFGCSRLEAFLRVTLPQIWPSVASGALFAFVTSLDEVVISMLISAGDNVTVTKVMFASLRDEIDPTIATVSTLLLCASIVALASLSNGGRRRSLRQSPVQDDSSRATLP